MEYIDINFIKANKDCKTCDHINNYVCFDCENIQVKKKYPKAKWELPNWVLNKKEE